MDTSQKIGMLEEALLRQKGKMTVELFSTVCSVVAFDDSSDAVGRHGDLTLQLPVLLHTMRNDVEKWLAQDQIDDM